MSKQIDISAVYEGYSNGRRVITAMGWQVEQMQANPIYRRVNWLKVESKVAKVVAVPAGVENVAKKIKHAIKDEQNITESGPTDGPVE